MDNRQGIRKTGVVVLIVLCALLIAVALRWTTYANRNKREQLGKEWTKLELILNQIQHNYVDSVNVADFIEKTVRVFWKNWTQHSIYLPPDELRTADENYAAILKESASFLMFLRIQPL